MRRSSYILLILILSGMVSCFKEEEYPVIPNITFTDFVVLGDSARLIFEFTDGDGDIGLNDNEVSSPYNIESYYYYNLYVEYWEKDDDVGWKPGVTSTGDTIIFAYRIKPFTNLEESKALKGTIEVLIEPIYYNPFSLESDTIMYKIKLIDRALNVSNIIETPEIVR